MICPFRYGFDLTLRFRGNSVWKFVLPQWQKKRHQLFKLMNFALVEKKSAINCLS